MHYEALQGASLGAAVAVSVSFHKDSATPQITFEGCKACISAWHMTAMHDVLRDTMEHVMQSKDVPILKLQGRTVLP